MGTHCIVTFHLKSYEIHVLVATAPFCKQVRLVLLQLKLAKMRSRSRFKGERLIVAFASFGTKTAEFATTQTQLPHRNLTISTTNNRNSNARVMSARTSILGY